MGKNKEKPSGSLKEMMKQANEALVKKNGKKVIADFIAWLETAYLKGKRNTMKEKALEKYKKQIEKDLESGRSPEEAINNVMQKIRNSKAKELIETTSAMYPVIVDQPALSSEPTPEPKQDQLQEKKEGEKFPTMEEFENQFPGYIGLPFYYESSPGKLNKDNRIIIKVYNPISGKVFVEYKNGKHIEPKHVEVGKLRDFLELYEPDQEDMEKREKEKKQKNQDEKMTRVDFEKEFKCGLYKSKNKKKWVAVFEFISPQQIDIAQSNERGEREPNKKVSVTKLRDLIKDLKIDPGVSFSEGPMSKKEFELKFGYFLKKRLYKGEKKDDNWISVRYYNPKKGVCLSGTNAALNEFVSVSEFDKLTDEYKPEITEEEKKAQNVRNAAEYTLSKMTKEDIYGKEGLNTEKVEESDKNFNELIKKLWKEFAVHGLLYVDEKTKEVKFKKQTDLDSKAFLYILGEAGIETKDLEYLKHGKYRKGAVSGDASGKFGVLTISEKLANDEEIKSLIFDHHTSLPIKNTCTAKKALETLTGLGLLEKKSKEEMALLEKLADFVTDEDNKNFTDDEIKDLFGNGKKYAKTLMGLGKDLEVGDIMKILGEAGGHKVVIADEILEKYRAKIGNKTDDTETLLDRSKRVEKQMERTWKNIEKLEKKGWVIESGGRFGKILVDTGYLVIKGDGTERIMNQLDFDVAHPMARLKGINTYVSYIPEEKRFQVHTELFPLGKNEFKQGHNVRGNFWSKPGYLDHDQELQDSLEGILERLCQKPVSDFKKDIEKIGKLEKEKQKNWERLKDTFEECQRLEKEIGEKIEKAKSGSSGNMPSNFQDLEKEFVESQGDVIGQNKKFQDWFHKMNALKKINGQLEKFETEKQKNPEPEKKPENIKFEERETEAIETIYIPFAKEYLEEMHEFFTPEKGYDQADISNSIKTEEKRLWEHELFVEILEDGKIRQEKIPAVVKLIQEKIKEAK